MATKRHRRHLTDSQAAGVRRLMMMEMRRLGTPADFVGKLFRVSGEAVRQECAKGLPDILDDDLVKMVVDGVAMIAHRLPVALSGRKPAPISFDDAPAPERPATPLETMRAERRARLAAKRAGRSA